MAGILPNAGVMNPGSLPGPTNFDGVIRTTRYETDGSLFVPASDWMFPDGTWTLTKTGAGLWNMLKTAGAATTNPGLNLSEIFFQKIGTDPMLEANTPERIPRTDRVFRGIALMSFDLLYKITVAGLTSITPTLTQTKFAGVGATAPVVSNPSAVSPAAGTAANIATSAQVQVASFTVPTPYVIGNNTDDTGDFLEVAVIDPGTSVFAFYGAVLHFAYCLN